MFCQKCKRIILDGTSVCPHCGEVQQKVSINTSNVSEKETPPSQPDFSKYEDKVKKIINAKILCAILICILSIVSLFLPLISFNRAMTFEEMSKLSIQELEQVETVTVDGIPVPIVEENLNVIECIKYRNDNLFMTDIKGEKIFFNDILIVGALFIGATSAAALSLIMLPCIMGYKAKKHLNKYTNSICNIYANGGRASILGPATIGDGLLSFLDDVRLFISIFASEFNTLKYSMVGKFNFFNIGTICSIIVLILSMVIRRIPSFNKESGLQKELFNENNTKLLYYL